MLLIYCRALTPLTVEILDTPFLIVGNLIVHLMTIQMIVRRRVFVLSVPLIHTEGHQM